MAEKIEKIIIDGKEYHPLSSEITRDHVSKEWILKDNSYKVISSLHLDKNTGHRGILEYAYFKYPASVANLCYSYSTPTLGIMYVLRKPKVLGNGSLIFDEETQKLYNNVDYDKLKNKNKNKFRAFNNLVKKFKDLDNENLKDSERKQIIERDILFGVRSNTFKAFEGQQYTFGVELETSSGQITEEECDGLNLKCEFDGSLREFPDQKKEDVLGGEYITGVLTGDAGIYQLQRICKVLSEKCTVNGKCGIHVHIGGLRFNKVNIVYMYLLGVLLQDEIFKILPYSRRDNSYCRKIRDFKFNLKQLNTTKSPLMYKLLIDEYYNIIHKEVSSGKLPDKKTNKATNHPLGSKCGYDKSAQRYCWLNFVTCMFNTKGSTDAYTLEFRNHHGSLNYVKIKNWTRLCVAFCAFAENHQESIRRGYWVDKDGEQYKISLSTIIKAIYPRSGKLLEEYVNRRKVIFADDLGQIEALEYEKDLESIKTLTLRESICA